ncbi:vWA-MoxR associated conflict system protein [Streptomyces galilaeus]|uniref:vWA-MoxR associated conflict system protein n=1 Tax=Streptomyces galilaeus TaxID=33899 RepID=UPI0038F6E563
MTTRAYPAGKWEKWKKTEPARLASYVNPGAVTHEFGSLGATFAQRSADLREAVRQVYNHLAAQNLPYETSLIDFEDYHEAEQIIRPPADVATEGGNCLELSLLFAGMCAAHKLRPLLVLLKNHALVAVWLGGDLEATWTTGRPAASDFRITSGGVGNLQSGTEALRNNLTELVEEGVYALVDCTGFARSGPAGAGTFPLTFDAAVAHGLAETCSRELVNIVDIAFLWRHRLHCPYPVPAASCTADAAVPSSPSYLRVSAVGSRALAYALDAAAEVIPQVGELLEQPGWSRQDISRLLDTLAGVAQCSERTHLVRLARGLDLALDAGAFITTWMPQAATGAALRRALLATTVGLRGIDPQGLSEHLDTVILRRPASDTEGRTALLGFVLRLAVEAGIDTEDQAFSTWCQDGGYDIGQANIMREKITAEIQPRDRRLLVHLRGECVSDWPEEGMAWLLDEATGQPVAECSPLSCEASAEGVAALLDEVLEWVHDLPEAQLLHRVDIAMPAPTLLCWRAEETDVGARLGAHHEVVVHWGERLRPPQHLRRLVRQARYRLRHIEQQNQVSGYVGWVSADLAHDQAVFNEELRKNTYPGALGLRFPPTGQKDQFEMLLAQFPILLWPEQAVPRWDAVEEIVRDEWVKLPGGFTTAYRTAWACRQDDEIPPLAMLRAVWDDHHWLDFCHTMSTHRAGIAPASGAGTGGHR